MICTRPMLRREGDSDSSSEHSILRGTLSRFDRHYHESRSPVLSLAQLHGATYGRGKVNGAGILLARNPWFGPVRRLQALSAFDRHKRDVVVMKLLSFFPSRCIASRGLAHSYTDVKPTSCSALRREARVQPKRKIIVERSAEIGFFRSDIRVVGMFAVAHPNILFASRLQIASVSSRFCVSITAKSEAAVRDVRERLEECRIIEMVQKTQTQDDVKAPIFLFAKISNVILENLPVSQPDTIHRSSCVLHPGGSAFDLYRFCSTASQFDGIMTREHSPSPRLLYPALREEPPR